MMREFQRIMIEPKTTGFQLSCDLGAKDFTVHCFTNRDDMMSWLTKFLYPPIVIKQDTADV